MISPLGFLFYGCQVLTVQQHLCSGPSIGSQLIDLISDETDIHYSSWGIEHINVPYGHSRRPAQLKNHAREGLRSGGLKGSLINDRLQLPRKIYV